MTSTSHWPRATATRVERVLRVEHDRDLLVDLLVATIRDDAEMRGLLSMWARRLVGDTLLVARAALRIDADDEETIEPVFTALVSNHSQRMTSMGLAA